MRLLLQRFDEVAVCSWADRIFAMQQHRRNEAHEGAPDRVPENGKRIEIEIALWERRDLDFDLRDGERAYIF
jgi:hypothetical protein